MVTMCYVSYFHGEMLISCVSRFIEGDFEG